MWRAGARRTFSARAALQVKKYTEDHEWIELDADNKVGEYYRDMYGWTDLGPTGREAALASTVRVLCGFRSSQPYAAV